MKQMNDKLFLRHPELEIRQDNPFENDSLSRKGNIEILTHLIESTTGSRAISVDAEWGNGKTTFLKMWAQHLRNQKHAVVELNAWETDFCKNPFIALFSGLEIALNQIIASVKKDRRTKVEKDNIFKEIKSFISRLNSISVGFAGLVMGIGIESNSDSVTNKNIIEYEKAIFSMTEFKCLLEQTASKLYELDYKSLVIVIDELDRCRPFYALELLEIIKHIFGVKDIVFILGINRSQFEHSIEALYGSKFDAKEYTRRYFDVDYKLPSPSRDLFIDNLISIINIQKYLKSDNDISGIDDFNVVKQMLKVFFLDSNISLRTIEQTIRRLGVVYTLLRKDRYSYIIGAVVMLIIKTIDSKIFEDFVIGNINDLDLVKKLPNKRRVDQSNEHIINCFEAIIILISMYNNLPIQDEPQQTQLYNHYKSLIENGSKIERQGYPGDVIKIVDNLKHDNWRGIANVIQRIEFVSQELMPSE